jgi:hypothetical protein
MKFRIKRDWNLFIAFLTGWIFFQLIAPGKTVAQGNLLLMPRRVVFEGVKKYEELNLANTGNDTARYIVSFIQIRMKEDGSFEEIRQPDSGQRFADKFLRFFPRSVVLAPNEAQVVKIQLMRTNELLPGEYRSHLYFRAIPNEKPLGEKETVRDTGISVKLIPVFGISIPIIIRVGESTTKINFSGLSLETTKDKTSILNMTLNRTGNMSVYGDITVDYISSQGKKTRVATVKGLAVYTPMPQRRHRMELDKIPDIDYHSGKLHLSYSIQNNNQPLAEAELVLQ